MIVDGWFYLWLARACVCDRPLTVRLTPLPSVDAYFNSSKIVAVCFESLLLIVLPLLGEIIYYRKSVKFNITIIIIGARGIFHAFG